MNFLYVKKLIFSAAVVAASVFGVYTANQNNEKANLSALQLENVEILAEGENNAGGRRNCRWNFKKQKCKRNGTHGICTCGSR